MVPRMVQEDSSKVCFTHLMNDWLKSSILPTSSTTNTFLLPLLAEPTWRRMKELEQVIPYWSFQKCSSDVRSCRTQLKRGSARVSKAGRSTTYRPTVYAPLPWVGLQTSLQIRVQHVGRDAAAGVTDRVT